MHVALFGGSFNPPHVGHLLAAAYVRAVAGVDAVWLMPAFNHPFGKDLAPFDDRVALCGELAAQLAGVEVSRVESELVGDGRTIHTVRHLSQKHPEHRFSLVVGSDILRETHKWLRFDELVALAPLIVLARSGHPLPADVRRLPGLGSAVLLGEVALPEVSSTEVRDRLSRGEPVEELVPRAVVEAIRARGLYR
jgi:nicotinate-nucleotide adenylyltransferase